MGWLSKLIGSPDNSLLSSGILGRGEVTHVEVSGMTLQAGNGLVERKCALSIDVFIDHVPKYAATVVQRVPEVSLALLARGVVVPVRVDAADHSRVAIDFAAELPTVALPAGEGHDTAAWVLENGKPVTVVVVQSQKARMTNAAGLDVWALTLTVAEGVETPYQIVVGNGVPASALPLLYPGAKLHAKLGDDPGAVVVDWAAGSAA